MAKIYFRQIRDGKILFADVPTRWKDAVRELLIDSGMEDLVTE